MYLGVVTLIVQTTRRKGSCWGAELFGWVEKMLYVGQPLKATRHQAQVTLIWLMNSRTTRSLQEGKRTTYYSDFPATINNSARLQKCMQSEAGKCSFVKNRFFENQPVSYFNWCKGFKIQVKMWNKVKTNPNWSAGGILQTTSPRGTNYLWHSLFFKWTHKLFTLFPCDIKSKKSNTRQTQNELAFSHIHIFIIKVIFLLFLCVSHKRTVCFTMPL